MTLVSPFYGSSEDVSDQSGEKEVFLEPPSDEKELCAQLKREIDWRELNVLHDKQLGQGYVLSILFACVRRLTFCLNIYEVVGLQ